MDTACQILSDLLGIAKSWIPWRSEPSHVSRDFWMPDESCRVCYECDSQFTLINRRHHCRLCGRVFCAKCTANSVPAQASDPRDPQEESDKIRVCNFCFKQWEKDIASAPSNGKEAIADLSISPSGASFTSSKSSCNVNSSTVTLGSMPSVEPSQQVSYDSMISPRQSKVLERNIEKRQGVLATREDHAADLRDPSSNQFGFCINRNDDDSDEYSGYQFGTRSRNFFQDNLYLGQAETDVIQDRYISQKILPDGGNVAAERLSNSKSFNSHSLEVIQQFEKKDENCIGDECEALSSISAVEDINDESVDFENNGLLWLPPEPEDEEDEREAPMFDDDEDAAEEWGYLQHSDSFGNGEHRARDKSCEDHKKVMKNVVDGHFRALLSQLLQVENLPFTEDDDGESWLEIITSLSWEAATLLKPNTSIGGGMDPGGYVKVKCLASGHRCESLVVKGVVCKKNLAHRRMTSNIEKPRFLILGGALEYQRVSNLLSSVDTLLRQEMDHLKMAVARIDSHQPDILLVEKSVSRFAQEYLLAKDISLVLNIKRPLLERIARCTGAEIVPSIDSLSSPKLGYCDKFHIQRFLEEHGSVGQNGKKSVKTLMYLEGCPKPLGCTILLRGANESELKKVKHVIQYGVFAAYHLALETSFLADEGASLPELPLNTPITVAFPDRSASIDRSISMVPGFGVPPSPRDPHFNDETKGFHSIPTSWSAASLCGMEMSHSPNILDGDNGQYSQSELTFVNAIASLCDSSENNRDFLGSCWTSEDKYRLGVKERIGSMIVDAKNDQAAMLKNLNKDSSDPTEAVQGSITCQETQFSGMIVGNQICNSEVVPSQQDVKGFVEEPGFSEEVFHPSPSDHQSILVSLSSRCVWKGTVCERSHLFRIKYYGSFDKPLGRFLRDHLFDPCYRCRSCEMPSEAHVQCYTHRQGTLTISVKNLPEIFLPGEREGKIWMWHRCLRCRRTNGFPPATRRVVMSDAAWGLSFGKFLELSFSNNAAASRVASCGHSLHRDCLRFYGFGKKVACFRYASIDVHSVYLPPSKLEFNYEVQDWIQKEFDEVADRAELLFSEVLGAVHQKLEKFCGIGASNSCMAQSESRHQLVELEGMLEREKVEFEASLKKTMNGEVKTGELVIDILEINRLRRQLSFQAYMWEHRLTYADSLHSNNLQESLGNVLAEDQGKPSDVNSKVNEMSRNIELDTGFTSCEAQVTNHSEPRNCDDEGGDKKLSISDVGVDFFPDENAAVEDLTCCTLKIDNSEYSDNSLQPENSVEQVLSDMQFPAITNLSDSLDAAWTGENIPETGTRRHNSSSQPDTVLSDSLLASVAPKLEPDVHSHQEGSQLLRSSSSASFTKDPDNLEDSVGWLGMPFLNFYRSLNKNFLGTAQKLDTFSENNPIYVPLFFESEIQNGARLLLPIGMNETVIPVYDDEPSSIISYALVSAEYSLQLSDDGERVEDGGESTISLSSPDSSSLQSFRSSEEITSGCHRRFPSADDNFLSSMIGSRNSQVPDPLSYMKTLHARVSFGDDSPLGKVKYTVTCYYAKKFEALRKICCPFELDYIRSLSRCKKWGAQGGKSNVFFAKTSDDRFIIKQVTKTELESFIKFAPGYFKYLTDSITSGSPTCLAKILGIYQITSRYVKGGKESKMDVLVMENLLFGKKPTQLYDLKGSSRSRYNPDSSGSNKVLLDQNLIEAMPTNPIFVSNKAKRLLERAVWNDTAFLASVDVMDYSLLVGVDEEKHELVLGIIDFMRQYTWDKHLETWVKASGILGGPKNASPTVISPKQYKKRFRKAMTTYFLMVPDQWSPSNKIPSKSQTDMGEENTKAGSD